MEIVDSWLVEIRSYGGRVTPPKRGHCDAKIKRLEKGSFRFPIAASASEPQAVEVKAADLMMILDGVDLGSVRRQRRYSRETLENPR